jgi:hypothetical protein
MHVSLIFEDTGTLHASNMCISTRCAWPLKSKAKDEKFEKAEYDGAAGKCAETKKSRERWQIKSWEGKELCSIVVLT